MSHQEASEQTATWPFWVVIAVVIALWALSGWMLYPLEGRGTIGDMFGAVNALFSGLAFAGVIYAVLLQRKELQLQRRELELTRAEMEGQKQQLAAQNETLKKQAFENTFFQLLRLHNEILNAIDLQDGSENFQGRDCIRFIYGGFQNIFANQWGGNRDIPEAAKIKESYEKFSVAYQSEIGHYFRTLYNMIKFVKESDVTDKRLYTNLIRAQLSNDELALLFYNCLSNFGSEKFKPLVEEFGLLKNMPKEILINSNEHARLFHERAYL